MWHNRETCVEVKQSRDMSVAIRCTNEELDHVLPLRLSGSAQNI
jgi:hypothetical protein